MGALTEERFVDEAEFWRLVETSDTKYEWFAGRIYAMAGGTYVHSRLIDNLAAALKSGLRGKPCKAIGSNLHVRIEAADVRVIPDNAIHCENARFEGKNRRSLITPIVVFEVLSPETEKYDRREKFELYTRIEEMQDYVLVSQDAVRVEHFSRREDGWLLRVFSCLEDVVALNSVDLLLSVSDLYDELDVPVQLTLVRPEDEISL